MSTPVRTSAIVSGIALALMAVLAPVGAFVALPENTGLAALIFSVVAVLDVAAAIALWVILRPGSELIALVSVALRIAYGAVLAAAAGALTHGDAEVFHTVWDSGLFMFGVHLALAGVALIRAAHAPAWIGILLAVSGLGYLADSAIAFVVAVEFEISTFTFVGEVALLVWLLGWAGRASRTKR